MLIFIETEKKERPLQIDWRAKLWEGLISGSVTPKPADKALLWVSAGSDTCCPQLRLLEETCCSDGGCSISICKEISNRCWCFPTHENANKSLLSARTQTIIKGAEEEFLSLSGCLCCAEKTYVDFACSFQLWFQWPSAHWIVFSVSLSAPEIKKQGLWFGSLSGLFMLINTDT